MISRNSFFSLVLLGVSLANIVVGYWAGYSFQDRFFNSDALYLPTLFSDLISKNGNVADWFLTPAPYFFPDYPIFLLAYIIGSNPYSQIIIFSLMQTLLAFCVIWLLVRQLSKQKETVIAATIMITLIWLALHSEDPFVFLLTSAFHYGVFLSSVACVALWLQQENLKRNQGEYTLFGLASVLAFLTALSDNLFIVQFVVPFVATVTLIRFVEKKFALKKFLFLIPVSFFSVLGSASSSFIVRHKVPFQADIGVEKLHDNLNNLYSIFLVIISNTPIYGVLFFIYLGVVTYSVFCIVYKLEGRRVPRPLAWIAIFSFVSLCSTLVVVALITNIPITSRYFIPALSWPVIVVFVFLSHYLDRKLLIIAVVFSFLVTASLSLGSYALVKSNGLSYRYYPNTVSCIDDVLEQYDAVNGIAQYWDAKYFQNFSRLNLSIAQYFYNLEEMHWITSEKYFREGYDFAIISDKADAIFKISSEALEHTNGRPRRVVSCDDKSVYIYGKDNLHVKKLAAIGSSYKWKGCDLPTSIGTKTAECEMKKKDVGQSGYVTYGPYQPLPTGQYSFEIAYSSPAKNTGFVGDWDVVLALHNGAKMLKIGPIVGTNGGVGKINGEFSVGENYNMEKIEIRTAAQQNVELKVIYIQVVRLQ